MMAGEGDAPVILWFRRDLRLDDHPALTAAVASGRPILPVFVHDETVETLGAAPRFRLGLGLEALGERLCSVGSRLILRRGRAADVLPALVSETGAHTVFWTRGHAPDARERDGAVVAALGPAGAVGRVFPGALLHEPPAILTGGGTPYAVFTPFWRALRGRDPGPALAAPSILRPPARWPVSEPLSGWNMAAGMARGAAVVGRYLRVGEAAAHDRLEAFLAGPVRAYAAARDFPGLAGTSGLSENLAWGEISPRRVWRRTLLAMETGAGGPGAETFLSELGWREFAWHLLAHHPHMARGAWRRGWDAFPWRADNADAALWRRAETGIAIVDAGMREMYATGRMHNRVRMIVASYLTKHLLTDWRVGLDWFADCLVDWDPAANLLGWQWVAGTGPDAAPYFRIFNPETQAARFDPAGSYRARFLAPDGEGTRDWHAAIPRTWRADRVESSDPAPDLAAGLAAGRARALAAHAAFRAAGGVSGA